MKTIYLVMYENYIDYELVYRVETAFTDENKAAQYVELLNSEEKVNPYFLYEIELHED